MYCHGLTVMQFVYVLLYSMPCCLVVYLLHVFCSLLIVLCFFKLFALCLFSCFVCFAFYFFVLCFALFCVLFLPMYIVLYCLFVYNIPTITIRRKPNFS